MNFDRAVEFVLGHEGEYSNDVADPGGETKFGISKRSYPSIDIKALTRKDAIGIYRKDYWNLCKCDQIPWPIAVILFDSAVNQGPVAAIRLLQKSLDVEADGVIGPNTIAAAFRASLRGTVTEFTARRAFHYATIPQVHRFGLGWFRRLAECQQIAMEPH